MITFKSFVFPRIPITLLTLNKSALFQCILFFERERALGENLINSQPKIGETLCDMKKQNIEN